MKKIDHICLCGPYTDGLTYQENLLPKYHQELGYDVEILATTDAFGKSGELKVLDPGTHCNEFGIQVTRIAGKKGIPESINRRLRFYSGVLKYLEKSRPDIIFFHGPCSHELLTAAKYAKAHPEVGLIVDGHEDFSNSARTFVSRNILHRGYYRSVIKRADRYVSRYWGTLPARCDFLHNVYGIDRKKIGLLVMGADDAEVKRASDKATIRRNRVELGFDDSDFVVVTGGKIDEAKRQVLALMDAVAEMDGHVRLLVFGPVVPSIKGEFDVRLSCKRITYIPWADTSASYDYFAVADLVAFPGRHSVYWEQAAAMGKPLLIKRWDGTTHVDCGGNVAYTSGDDENALNADLVKLMKPGVIGCMSQVAMRAREGFLYSEIARRSIDVGVGA